ncbi:hypothetical protein ACFQ7F_09190 [Streptomyces sp. NPDC056486]|uniref:hypothetical protein n=1 Tax=Streptomyces sp. NPDC056486 TaxID=3345835 RepID=UPI00368D519B
MKKTAACSHCMIDYQPADKHRGGRTFGGSKALRTALHHAFAHISPVGHGISQ